MSDFTATPMGLRHKGLINLVASGTRLVQQAHLVQKIAHSGHVLAEIHRNLAIPSHVAPEPQTEWLSHADWENDSGVPLQSFQTTWRVPPPPTTKGDQTIFLFNSMKPHDGGHILQPVLQWGASSFPAAEKRWAVASWWVGAPDEPLFITDLVPVSTGDTLVGLMTLASGNGMSFEYTCEFVGVPGTKLVISNVPELTICSEALEVSNISQPSDFPQAARTTMGNIAINAGGANAAVAWMAAGRSPPAIVNNSGHNGQVDLHYPAQWP